MTEVNDQYRREKIKRFLSVFESEKTGGGLQRTLQVEYRGALKLLPVITIDPNTLVLNHNNHRLTAQLEDHPKKEVVFGSPTSSEAQTILSELLSATTEFKNLKEELKQFGQHNPGLITNNGLLVNGNTRVVALRQLGKAGVDVAVLPDDADAAAILDLEMVLQMVHLTHQDYTFTNELLLLEKCRKLGNSDEQIAKKMKWVRGWQKKVNEKFQLLRLINEIRGVSRIPIAYKEFDTKSQHLKDLNDQYESLKSSDVRAANKMKWARIAAIFLGVNKDQTRAIDEDFIDDDVLKRTQSGDPSSGILDPLKRIQVQDDLGDILGEQPSVGESIDVKELAKSIINERVDDKGFISSDELNPGLEDMRKKFVLSAEEIITKAKRRSLLATPSDELKEIRESLENVVQIFNEVSGQKGFDVKKFEYELEKAKKSLRDLDAKFQRHKTQV